MVIKLERVSIIVPVFNSEKTVKRCIESLLDLDYPKNKLEIIFVDDGSKDMTKEIIKSYRQIRLVEQEHRGPAATRNNGFRNSSGNFIFFTDSDCIVPKNWIKEMLGRFGKDIAMVGGGLVPFSLETLSEKFEQNRRDRLYGDKKRLIEALPSCNMAIRRDVFEKVKGFDEQFRYPSFEDYDLCYRIRDLGYNILYDPKIGVVHLHSSTWKGVFRRAFMHGREGVKFRKKIKFLSSKEILFFFKLFLLPLMTLKYSKKFILVSMLYNFITLVGEIFGIIKYGMKREFE